MQQKNQKEFHKKETGISNINNVELFDYFKTEIKFKDNNKNYCSFINEIQKMYSKAKNTRLPIDDKFSLIDLKKTKEATVQIDKLANEISTPIGIISSFINVFVKRTCFLGGEIWSYLNYKKSLDYFKRYQYYLSQFQSEFEGYENDGVIVYSFRKCNKYTYFDLVNESITLVNPKLMNDPFDSLVTMWIDNYKVKDLKDNAYIEIFKKSFQFYRIRSFCANRETMDSDEQIPQNILMWSHYANGHKGICIKYRLKHDFIKKRITDPKAPLTHIYLKRIDYENNDHTGEIIDISNENITADIGFARKHKDWKYENEVRLISYDATTESDIISLPINKNKENAMIEAIYFGCKCSKYMKSKIKRLMKNTEDIEFFDIKPDTHNIYQLKIVPSM